MCLAIIALICIGLYYYLDPETCWSNIRTPMDFIELFVLRTQQKFCRHEWKYGKLGRYCTKCHHTEDY